jgi:hemoglobin
MNLIETPLFERIGGRQTINALVDSFYDLIMNDKDLAKFFENINPHKLAGKQIAFMTLAFGGPSTYEHENLRNKHKLYVVIVFWTQRIKI